VTLTARCLVARPRAVSKTRSDGRSAHKHQAVVTRLRTRAAKVELRGAVQSAVGGCGRLGAGDG
jgi:hypothetical protein